MKNILILFLILACIVLMLSKGCHKATLKNVVKSDTTIIHKRDTIWAKDTIFIHRANPRLVDSIYVFDTINSILCDYIRNYKDTLEDSNMTAYTDYVVRGQLIGSGMSYKLKIPLIIYDSTKVTINTVKELKMGLYGGLETGYKSVSPYIDFKLKKLDLGISYDIYNKSPKLRIGYRIFSR